MVGSSERNLKMLREAFGLYVTARDGRVTIRGDRAGVSAARRVLARLAEAAERGEPMSREDVLDAIASEAASGRRSWARHPGKDVPDENGDSDGSGLVDAAHVGGVASGWDGRLDVYAGGRPVSARSANQQRYLDAIRDHDMVFGIGPAGTGKTYLAVAAAVHFLKSGRAQKVVLARPAVEAGERLGFLPGTLEAKVNPYLRPLFDALHDMMDFPTIRRFIENDVVEVVPLAFMRGRTLNNAVIILDEAQNTTRGQMKMFLTRMGRGSKMIVTGDVTQIDLEDPRDSGLVDAARRLTRTAGVAFCAFERGDVVRHALVQRVIDAYGEEERRGPEAAGGPPASGSA